MKIGLENLMWVGQLVMAVVVILLARQRHLMHDRKARILDSPAVGQTERK